MLNERILLFFPDTMFLYSVSHIREDSDPEMQEWGRGAEMHSPHWRGWKVGETWVSLSLSTFREGLPFVFVPGCVEGLSSGGPWGAGVSTLTWVIPAKVRLKPEGQYVLRPRITHPYMSGCLAGISSDTTPTCPV